MKVLRNFSGSKTFEPKELQEEKNGTSVKTEKGAIDTFIGLITTTKGTEAVKDEAVKDEAVKDENVKEKTVEDQTDITNLEQNRNIVCVCKMGSEHARTNMNNHDFAFRLLNMKVVMDGCGSGKHSEVGTKVFGQLFARRVKEYVDKGETIGEENILEVVNSVFERMLGFCNDTTFIFQNYCFTILICLELEDEFVVYSCGDGYIIKENKDGIIFEQLDDGEYPCYYVYNFIEDKSVLMEYQEGVNFKITRFKKNKYFNVGVASDGLRFWEKLYDAEKNKLKKFLHEGKGAQIDILINRNNRRNEIFHDDISICF